MIAFLRDTDQEVSNLRLPENRVALFAEIGSVMWQFDEQQARALYAKAVGDLQQLMDLLAPDVTLLTDGGGKVSAALRPIQGADKVARFLDLGRSDGDRQGHHGFDREQNHAGIPFFKGQGPGQQPGFVGVEHSFTPRLLDQPGDFIPGEGHRSGE